MKLAVPKGTKDVLSIEMEKYRQIENIFSNVCKNYGYGEITTPVFEFTELFKRGVGETTDVVSKEMYTFLDKGNRSLTLRPEGTAGVVRSYINNGMTSLVQPVKLYYMGKMYRYENVQKGRYREFTQIGLEAFGSSKASIDVEIISLVNMFFEKLGISDLQLMINSIGCKTCRLEYNKKLKNYYEEYISGLCSDCKIRYTKNPLRLLDCKVENCQKVAKNAPLFMDNLCGECLNDFSTVKQGLDNLEIDFTINKTLVRGLDYYTKTVFEFISDNVGTQGTICAGGRYDDLVELLGGKQTPGIGFAMGVERLLMELESREINMTNEVYPVLYIATLGEKAYSIASKIAYELRKQNIYVDIDVSGRGLKAQMKYANKKNVKYVVVIGENEIASNKCKIKIMETGVEKQINVDAISEIIIENKA
ncbi:MAG: histidine--tRNA ligase [Clostridiales bacterium]|nr:histidine--tRNA ligase [Clostridiales bacterium]